MDRYPPSNPVPAGRCEVSHLPGEFPGRGGTGHTAAVGRAPLSAARSGRARKATWFVPVPQFGWLALYASFERESLMFFPSSASTVRRLKSNQAGRRPALRKAGLQVQLLEDRLVPTIIFGDPGARILETGGNRTVLQNAHVELIFWGTGWTSSQATATENDISKILSSPYLSSLSQYGGINPATLAGEVFVTDSSPPSITTPKDVAQMLQAELPKGALPLPSSDPKLLYMVLTQPGTTGQDNSPKQNPISGCHDHDSFQGANFPWAFTINTGEDSVTNVFSHEMNEARSLIRRGRATYARPRFCLMISHNPIPCPTPVLTPTTSKYATASRLPTGWAALGAFKSKLTGPRQTTISSSPPARLRTSP